MQLFEALMTYDKVTVDGFLALDRGTWCNLATCPVGREWPHWYITLVGVQLAFKDQPLVFSHGVAKILDINQEVHLLRAWALTPVEQ